MRGPTKLSIAARAVAREVGDEVVILDLDSATYYGLDRVGARVWRLIAAGHTRDEIGEALLAEYEVERSLLQSDLNRLIAQLIDSRLATVDATPPPA